MKNTLRLQAKAIRNKLDVQKTSERMIELILDWDKFKNAKNVMVYCPIKNEPDLLSLLNTAGKNFYLPRIENEEICAAKFTSFEDLKTGKFDIKEPCTNVIAGLDTLDLIFIPALMTDKWGYRLGFGKGYYDKFLNKLPARTTKVIPMYKELFIDELPIEPHDEKADFVITEDEIIETRILLS